MVGVRALAYKKTTDKHACWEEMADISNQGNKKETPDP